VKQQFKLIQLEGTRESW